MKILRPFLFLLLCSFCAMPLSNSSGEPSQALLNTLAFAGIENDGSWNNIVEQTQQQLRAPGKELWEVEPVNCDPEYAYELFSNLTMTQSIDASYSHYKYAVVLGSTVSQVTERFLWLKKQWDAGVRYDELVLLTGDRKLASFEIEQLNNPDLDNETEMMVYLSQQLNLPNTPLTVVDTPAPSGKRRPTTHDTFVQWLNVEPEPGLTLLISTQPFIWRQNAIAHNVLPKTFCIDTIGKGVPYELFVQHPRATAIYLETLYRWIYEVHH